MFSSVKAPRRTVRLGNPAKCIGRFGMLLCVLASFGCIPMRFNTSPGASGVVLDSRTRAPIDGAQVLVSRLTYPPPSVEAALTNCRPPVIITASAGHFSIPAERRFDLYVLPIDLFPRFGMLVVKRYGYESAVVPFWSKSVKDLGEVALAPVSK